MSFAEQLKKLTGGKAQIYQLARHISSLLSECIMERFACDAQPGGCHFFLLGSQMGWVSIQELLFQHTPPPPSLLISTGEEFVVAWLPCHSYQGDLRCPRRPIASLVLLKAGALRSPVFFIFRANVGHDHKGQSTFILAEFGLNLVWMTGCNPPHQTFISIHGPRE